MFSIFKKTIYKGSSGKYQPTMAEFLRTASPQEQRKLLVKVGQKANEDQRKLLDLKPAR